MIIGYITGQSLKIQVPVIVSDSINYLKAQFFFQTEDWQGLTKWAHFKQGENVYDFALENDRIEKEAHLNLSDGEWEVYLHGNEFADGEVVERITTEIVTLIVKKSGVLEGDPFAEQPASEVERLNAKLEKILDSGIGGAVSSVNGKDGDVVLTAEDVGALSADTIIPEVPAQVSAFENDAGYQTAQQVKDAVDSVAGSIPVVPTKISEFQNDAKYQTDVQVSQTAQQEANRVQALIPTVPENVSAFENDATYQTQVDVERLKSELLAEIAKKQDILARYVSTINGKNGDVVLGFADVGALSADAPVVDPAELQAGLNLKQDVLEKYVSTVNGMSGDVQLTASDVGALPDSTVIPTVPTVVSAFTNDADYATRTFVQETVNGKNIAFVFDSVAELDTWLSDSENVSRLKTGDVFWIRDTGVPDYWWDGENQTKQIMETTKVDLSDYALKNEIPKKTSELQNDSDFTTNANVDTKLGAYQLKLTEFVKTVNGKSGEVVLTSADVGALPASTVIPTVPTNVSAFANDAKYATTSEVEQAASAVEAKIPVVPTNVSAFANDAGYVLATAVEAALAKKQNALTFDSTPTAGSQNPVTSDGVKTAIDEAADCFFYVPFKLGTTGFELDGVTYDEIMAAYNDGKRIVGKGYVPSAAGLGVSGNFELPLSYLTDSNVFVLTMLSGLGSSEARINSDGTITTYAYALQTTSNKVDSLSASATNNQYPSAKATYDFVIAQTGGLTFKVSNTVPTVDDRSVITFVFEG